MFLHPEPHAHNPHTQHGSYAVGRRWYQLVLDNSDDIAILMTAESGKPLKESKVEAVGGSVPTLDLCTHARTLTRRLQCTHPCMHAHTLEGSGCVSQGHAFIASR